MKRSLDRRRRARNGLPSRIARISAPLRKMTGVATPKRRLISAATMRCEIADKRRRRGEDDIAALDDGLDARAAGLLENLS